MHRFLKLFFDLSSIPFKIVFNRKKFNIKRGYIHRRQSRYYDNTSLSEEFQNEVYLEAKKILSDNGFENVLDLGCGSAYKLIQHFGTYNTIGIDVKETVEFLMKKYPERNWISTENFDPEKIETDIVICADVIEHIVDPLEIIEQIRKINNVKYIIISTPERNIVNGCLHYGPPKNLHHIREWSGWEFKGFVNKYFHVISHSITNYEQGTQMIICSIK